MKRFDEIGTSGMAGSTYNSTYKNLHLTREHTTQLAHIGYQGGILMVVGLLWWGVLAPQFVVGREGLPLETASRLSGITMIIILATHFISAYFVNVRSISKDQRIMGFIIFWFNVSLFFNIAWQLPLWSIPWIRNNVKNLVDRNLWWAIIWWCYSLSDRLYLDCTPTMITFEIWRSVGNIFGFLGLYKFRNKKVKEALVLFLICGVCQAYNATIYMFTTYYVEEFRTISPKWGAHFIFWGFNGLWAIMAAVSAFLSWYLLFSTIKYDK